MKRRKGLVSQIKELRLGCQIAYEEAVCTGDRKLADYFKGLVETTGNNKLL